MKYTDQEVKMIKKTVKELKVFGVCFVLLIPVMFLIKYLVE
ncbi:hypothetical protein [Brevibacillus sp. SYSU BS000544]